MLVNLFPTNERVQRRLKPDTDFDVLTESELTDDEKSNFKIHYDTNKVDFHVIPPIWNLLSSWKPNFHKYPHSKIPNIQNIFFTLKASHVPFDKIWKDKTFYDLQLMNVEGCQVMEPLFFELYDYWTVKFGDKWRADFTKESADFFNDAVSRENLHDELHKSVAYYEVPAFKYLQEPEQTTVWVCPEKFKQVTEHIRQRVVIEEAQALALERFILPDKIKNKHIAYTKMLKALVDRLCPKWMVPYIVNNLNYFLTFKEDYNYYGNLNNTEHTTRK